MRPEEVKIPSEIKLTADQIISELKLNLSKHPSKFQSITTPVLSTEGNFYTTLVDYLPEGNTPSVHFYIHYIIPGGDIDQLELVEDINLTKEG